MSKRRGLERRIICYRRLINCSVYTISIQFPLFVGIVHEHSNSAVGLLSTNHTVLVLVNNRCVKYVQQPAATQMTAAHV